MLEKYKKKRNFNKTPEPLNKDSKAENQNLVYVVQKHQASRLHYDFRLELNGVLKSWAIPKGPSLNPEDKRLAVMVEDHPLDYRNFEGVIPKGNYGAGTVMIWDSGVYQPLIYNSKVVSKKEREKLLLKGLEAGHITFILNGKKLKGEFALIKLRNAKENDAWLLVKANKDEYAGKIDVLQNDLSVNSGKNLDEISKPSFEKDKYWSSEKDIDLTELEKLAIKTKFPLDIKPMKATLIKEPFDDKDWIFEVKWDGYRAITEVHDGNVRLYSRNNKDFNDKFPQIANAFQSIKKEVVFDGEIVALDEEGKPSFQLLQEYLLNQSVRLVYYVFDILYYEGFDLTKLTLEKRKEILKKALPNVPNVLYNEEIPEKGISFFQAAKDQNLEGIMAKKTSSLYHTGVRSKDWLKIKNIMEQEFVIGGYSKPRGSRNGFGSLLLGVYERDNLVYVSNVGTGFDERFIAKLMEMFEPLRRKNSPFSNLKIAKDTTWLEPRLVCEVKFQEWTNVGGLRQPVFLGLRDDKNPKEVSKEKPTGENNLH